MASLPYMRFYAADYLADTHHLSTEEHGAYLLLLLNYWQSEKPLNNANHRLAYVARMSNDRWISVEKVLSEFFDVRGDEWTHQRVEYELDAVLVKSTKASFAGKESARLRANARLSANHEGIPTDVGRTLSGRSDSVQRNVNHKDKDKDKDKDTNKDLSKIKEPIFSPEVIALADYFADSLESIGCKKQIIAKTWLEDFDKMIRLDERTPQQIRAAITWAHADGFWAGNILSPMKLRKQFERLRLTATEQTRTDASPTKASQKALALLELSNRLEAQDFDYGRAEISQ